MTITNQAAITLVNAELYENAQAFAALHERQRIAQNLHDAVNQSLFSAGLIAEVLPRLWEREPQEARRSLEDLRRLTRGAMAEMRALLAEIRPDTLIDTELEDLLLLLGNAFSGRTNVPVYVTLTDNWIEMTLRYIVRISERREIKTKLHSELLKIFEAEPAITIASSTFEIVGIPPLKGIDELEEK